MSTLRFALLGPPQITRADGTPVTFRSRKELALLAYLAVEHARPHQREALLALLWPDASADDARNSLRVVLANLRRALGAAAGSLVVDRQTVRLRSGDDGWLDVAAFKGLLGACKLHHHERRETCPACVQQLDHAVDLYGGDFLAGFSLPDAPAFEEWMLLARADLNQLALGALAKLTVAHEAASDYEAVCRRARQQLALEPWHEPGHRALMRGLAFAGDRVGALAHYEVCRRVLTDELGVEPEEDTRALVERIRAGELAPPTRAADAPSHVLPLALMPLVGREAELAALRTYADTRLLTLVGAGGIGKTRLVLELARAELDRYADGVFFVPLAPLDLPDAIVPAIATALHLSLYGDPMAALLRYLHGKHMLLVLDNFEHLLDGATLVTTILETAHRARIVVTSRERLHVRGEQVYAVEGLRYRAGATLAEAAIMPSVQLFAQSAQRAQDSFALNEATLEPVLRICQLTQGIPLALELAAAWVDGLPLAEIAAEIEHSADFLAADWRDVPGRHRSMRAVFDWSWRLLGAQEQRALCRLTIFRDGWTREAAEVVAETSPQVLTRLVRKSLVRWDERQGVGGRYMMLEPLRQFAAERFSAKADDLANRHCDYYLRLLASQESVVVRDEIGLALDAINAEYINLSQAWIWALEHAAACAHLLDASVYAFSMVYFSSGRYNEQLHPFNTIDRLRALVATGGVADPEREVRRRAMGKLLVMAAVITVSLGQSALGFAQAQEAIAVCRETGAIEGELYTIHLLGIVSLVADREGGEAMMLANLARVRAALEHGATSEMLHLIEWDCPHRLAVGAEWRGDAAAMRRWAQEGLQVSRRQASPRGEVSCLGMLVIAERAMGDQIAAQRSLEQLQLLARPNQHPSAEGMALHGFGELAFRRGRYTEAQAMLERALAVFHAAGDIGREGTVFGSLIQLFLILGAEQAMHACFEQFERLVTAHLSYFRATFRASLLEVVRALLVEQRGDADAGIAAAEQTLATVRATGEQHYAADVLVMLGRAHERAERWEEATAAHAEALATYEELGRIPQTTEPLAGLARIALGRGDLAAALAHAERLLAILAAHPWAGLGSPFALSLACYHALDAHGDPRAAEVLHNAQERLQTCAEQIADREQRRSFMENVAAHREILALAGTANHARQVGGT